MSCWIYFSSHIHNSFRRPWNIFLTVVKGECAFLFCSYWHLERYKSRHSWGDSLFLQLRHASGTLYHLILDLVFVPQNSNLFSKLILSHRFLRTNFVVSVFFCFCFFYCALNTQQSGYVRTTSLIIVVIIIKLNISPAHLSTPKKIDNHSFFLRVFAP